jgi:hypothetical protein
MGRKSRNFRFRVPKELVPGPRSDGKQIGISNDRRLIGVSAACGNPEQVMGAPSSFAAIHECGEIHLLKHKPILCGVALSYTDPNEKQRLLAYEFRP